MMVILPVGRSKEASTKTAQSSFSKAQTVPFVTYVDAKKARSYKGTNLTGVILLYP